MPGNLARSAGVRLASSSTRRSSSSRVMHVALDAGLGDLEVALGRGREVADRPADADQPRPAAPQPRRALELGRDVAHELADLLGLGRAVAGQEALGHAHRAQAPGVELARVAADDVDELHRAAADVEHDPVGERRRVDRRQVAVARLLLAAEHAHAQAAGRLGALEEGRGVRRVADGGRRDREDVVGLDAAGRAEVGEDLHRRLRARHPGLAQLAGGRQALADAHRLVDLVGALPPAVGRGEDDQAERVRPEVGDGDVLGHVAQSSVAT